ncbi:single-stranded DNA-binding protein [Gordonia crocea]|uniref:Single-stranded DNA-binding protein n=1 Tax=Gordonia crocea TaxID=589162 RepID=A0A7I9UXC3_9ACTN|nr:single-stranded DNA-binding protein [Gordonia crocea]GED97536.1 single-stranded DNA-binding protein [Gordonia crocea]
MFETSITVIGNVITDPVTRNTSAGEVVSFRMASNSRRRDPVTNEWINDKTLFLTVSCWRKLAAGVAASVEKGRAIIASGTVHTSEYTTGDGEYRASLEMNATAVGIDLSRSIVKVCGYPAGPAPIVEVVDPDAPQIESDPDPESNGSPEPELAPA